MLFTSLLVLGSLVWASPSPRQSLTGTLQVSTSSGFVGIIAARNPINGVTFGISTPLTVSFDPTSSPFDIEITNTGYTGPFYLGASGGVQGIGLDSLIALNLQTLRRHHQIPPQYQSILSHTRRVLSGRSIQQPTF
ncbi:hypothetical protein DL96DRAFT_696558 [Flagelloscypha sp. PMI_526]|nr:hypothetical protein DL96DRAFT_696558 [Flagelloscypha sp. PMI_526]